MNSFFTLGNEGMTEWRHSLKAITSNACIHMSSSSGMRNEWTGDLLT